MNVVLIIDAPYWDRDHHRFGMDYLMDRGYDVEIWRIITSESISFETSAGMYRTRNYHEYSSKEFKKRIAEKQEAIFIVFSVNKNMFPIIKAGCNYIVISAMGAQMDYPYSDNISSSLLGDWRQRFNLVQRTKNLKKRVTRAFLKKKESALLSVNMPILLATSTQYAAKKYGVLNIPHKNIMYIHSFDYDRFLESKGASFQECILYCDAGYFYQSQDLMLEPRTMPTIEHSDECLKQLEVLFDKMEEYYGVPVIVAGHPHTQYTSDTMCGRRIIFNNIGPLASNAKLFILQSSTAISFAVLNNLPILQVVNKYMRGTKIFKGPGFSDYDYIQYQTTVLGSGFLDLDDEEKMERPWDCVRTMPIEKRELYKKKYIIDSNKDRQLVIEYIDEFIQQQNFG